MDRNLRRLELQKIFEDFAKSYVKKGDRTSHVYYNPPTGFQLEYPCIVYEDARPKVYHAENKRYFERPCWTVTVMTFDPTSSDLAPLVETLPYCSYDTTLRIDNVSQKVYSVY